MSTATSRLEARIDPELHRLIKHAATLQGCTLTDFVVTTLRQAAQRAIEESELVRLSLADQQLFADALIAPPAPEPALQRAFTRRRQLLRSA